MYPDREPSASEDEFDPKAWVAGALAWERTLARLEEGTAGAVPAEKVASLRRARDLAAGKSAQGGHPSPASAA